MAAYRSWLRETLRLTLGGRVAFTILLSIGLLAGAAGTGFAFYNVGSGRDPDQVLGLQIVFSWVVVAVLEAVALALVAVLDAAFRGVASRFAKPS
jgi:hypothetical protein